MDWFRRGLTQFRSVSGRDRIPVLLCGASAVEFLSPTEFESIPNQTSLASQVDNLSRRLGTLWVDKCIAAASDLLSGIAVTPEGFPGRVSFPIFPFRSANKEVIKRLQCVTRDQVESKTFARFFGLFRKLPDSLRPRVLFLNDSQPDSVRFFQPIRDIVDLYEIFPDRLSPVPLNNSHNHRENYFDFLSAGSFSVSSDQPLIFPDSKEDIHTIQKKIVSNYHVCMSQQHDSDAFSSVGRKNVNELLWHIDHYLLHSSRENTDFLISAKIQSLLLKILIEDNSSHSLYEAISLSKAVENTAYEQKCLRFSNQIAGVSSYALDCLRQSAEALAHISQNESFNPLHRLEYFAVMQNIFITRLFGRKNVVDAGEAVSCLEFATEQHRYFDELSMLANSVGLSFLVSGNLNEADKYLQLATTYGADRLTHLNIRINHFICRYFNGDRPSNELLSSIFDEYRTLPFEQESGYHAAMAFGNLWRLSSEKSLKSKITRAAKERGFLNAGQDGDKIISALKRRGFLFMNESSFVGPFGALVDHAGFMPPFISTGQPQ